MSTRFESRLIFSIQSVDAVVVTHGKGPAVGVQKHFDKLKANGISANFTTQLVDERIVKQCVVKLGAGTIEHPIGFGRQPQRLDIGIVVILSPGLDTERLFAEIRGTRSADADSRTRDQIGGLTQRADFTLAIEKLQLSELSLNLSNVSSITCRWIAGALVGYGPPIKILDDQNRQGRGKINKVRRQADIAFTV